MNDSLQSKVLRTDFEKLFKKLGYKFFPNGQYNLNIIGIRAKGTTVNNHFNDILVVEYNNPTYHVKKTYAITTEPGLYYMEHPCSAKGAAILVPGQYRNCWTIGKHQGKYKALVQTMPVKVYRDNNKNKIYDCNPETIDTGVFGINIHKAGNNSVQVDKWSAGCQVFSSALDFQTFMNICEQQVKHGHGTKFSYTLLNEEDLCPE